MSARVEVGQRRIFRSKTAREIEVTERLTEGEFAGEFRYGYVDTEETGILSAEDLETSTYPAPTNPSGGAVTSTPAPSGDTTPEAIRDRVLRDVLNSDAMAALLTTDAFLNAAKWRFLQAGLTILAEQGLLSDPEAVSR